MKIFKETLIMLLTCLAGILLFAVVFYKYIPNKKDVPEIKKYSASETVLEQLADNVDQDKDKIIKTYEVTSLDLNNYKVTKDYVPGKANPFASPKENVETNATTENPNDKGKTSNNSSTDSGEKTNSSSDTTQQKEKQEEYMSDKGTK